MVCAIAVLLSCGSCPIVMGPLSRVAAHRLGTLFGVGPRWRYGELSADHGTSVGAALDAAGAADLGCSFPHRGQPDSLVYVCR